jgi:hypothetical protein
MISFLTRSSIASEAADKFATHGNFNLKGADGYHGALSSVIVAPVSVAAPVQPEDAHNMIIAGIHVENAKESASLPNGFFTIRFTYENGIPGTEVLLNGQLFKKSQWTRLIPTSGNFSHPEVIASEVSSIEIFVAGVIVGMVIGRYMR